MTLQEAIKSGRPFKRKKTAHYLVARSNYNSIDWEDLLMQPYLPNLEDILASDWEVKEESITITKRQLFDVLLEHDSRYSTTAYNNNIWEALRNGK